MRRQCEGYGRPLESTQLVQCPYDALSGDAYCYLHRKIVDGLITDYVGQRRDEGVMVLEHFAWSPTIPAHDAGRDWFEILLEEWPVDAA